MKFLSAFFLLALSSLGSAQETLEIQFGPDEGKVIRAKNDSIVVVITDGETPRRHRNNDMIVQYIFAEPKIKWRVNMHVLGGSNHDYSFDLIDNGDNFLQLRNKSSYVTRHPDGERAPYEIWSMTGPEVKEGRVTLKIIWQKVEKQ